VAVPMRARNGTFWHYLEKSAGRVPQNDTI
jgi:hypothetical protein